MTYVTTNSNEIKLRILAIENEMDDIRDYIDPLSMRHDIEKAFSIEQAIEMIKGEQLNSFDLILLDVMIPILKESYFTLQETNRGLITGLVFFDKYLKGKPAEKPISVILLTGASTGELQESIRSHYNRNRSQIVALKFKRNTDPSDLGIAVDSFALKYGGRR